MAAGIAKPGPTGAVEALVLASLDHRIGGPEAQMRRRRGWDLNPRRGSTPLTFLAGRRFRPDSATSPRGGATYRVWDDRRGAMAEWTKAAVLKTAGPQGSGGSNPSRSARFS